MSSTPLKIIAAILIPLIIAVIIRFSNREPDEVTDKNLNPMEKAEKNDSGRERSVKVLTTWLLPDVLKEISGISRIDADHFACVQDERGTVYIYNIRTSSIDKEIAFAGKGDYEGIAIAGQNMYILQANGSIFEISNYTKTDPAVKLYKTHLGKKQDSESLAFDKKNNRLLIAVKSGELDGPDYKGIYAFDLRTKTMNTKPVFRIDLRDPVFGDEKSPGNAIHPSDMEVHPATGYIYIIEGTKPKLLILKPDGAVQSLFKLKGNEFSQPEGISISPEGLIYISNEGKDNPGNILLVELDVN